MTRWLIKMGYFEKMFPGKKQKGLDLRRVTEDSLLDMQMATRTDDCCKMFPALPIVTDEADPTIPNNSLFAVAEVIYWKSGEGNLFTVDITAVP